MRKISFVLSISLVFVLLFSGCGQAGQLGTVSAPPEVTPSGEPATSGDTPAASPSPEASPQLKLDNELRTQTFLAFIKDSYPQLSEAFFGGISGIGFIDLDCDTGVEMLIFDSGASASMGLQFFDIIDDKVECVSANLTSVKDAYAKEHYSDVIVNANTFDSFRMMLDSATEKKFFLVSSGNGASVFTYKELIRFGSDNGVLTLESLLYLCENFDETTGEATSTEYKVEGKPADKTAYDTKYQSIYSAAKDTGYEAKGAFAWNNTVEEYEASQSGLLKMAQKAVELAKAQSDW